VYDPVVPAGNPENDSLSRPRCVPWKISSIRSKLLSIRPKIADIVELFVVLPMALAFLLVYMSLVFWHRHSANVNKNSNVQKNRGSHFGVREPLEKLWLVGELLVLLTLAANHLTTGDRPDECREVAALPPFVAQANGDRV
jgi:heme/copper-type cytochrome/quinol oxidase subunit 2